MLTQSIKYTLPQINTCPHSFSTSVAFKGSADTIIDEKVTNFSNDLITLLNERPNISYKNIEELIRKTTGERIKVRPYCELEQNEQTYGTVAFYKAPIGASVAKNGQLKVVEGEREIFVDLPKDNSNNAKSTFIRSTVHEFTHLCQDKYGVYSKKDLMSTLVGSAMLSMDAKINTLNATQPARIEYINPATKALVQALQNANIGDSTNIDSATSEYLSSIMLPVTNRDISRYCRRNLNKAMEKVPQNANKQYIMSYLSCIAKREEQANQNGSKAVKEYLKDNNSVGYDLFAVLYRNLADACK